MNKPSRLTPSVGEELEAMDRERSLVVVEQPRPLDAYRMSTDAAGVCGAIVKQTAKPIQGRKYVTVEGWQAIAIAHGCAASADNVERVTDEGASGFKATGVVRRMSDGQEIARAEGFLGDDEQMWAKRPVYARRAMVQTRAISRACRSAFAHVVVMIDAGLQTTPAEEMVYADAETGEVIEHGPATEEHRDPTIPGITKIRNNLNKLRRDGGKAEDLEAFNALVHGCKDDLEKIRDAGHSLWTGSGEDWDGFRAWIKRRREELAGSIEYQMLVSCVNECDTLADLQAFLAKHGEVIEALDGAESRKFEEIYDLKETILKAGAPVDA